MRKENMNEIEKIVAALAAEKENQTLTQNGDLAYKSTNDHLVDLLFKTEYLREHLDEVEIGSSNTEKLFAMMIRDPRFGLGQRNVGRRLMRLSGCTLNAFLVAGRADDIWKEFYGTEQWTQAADFLLRECENVWSDNNVLVRKWMPRYPRKNILKDKQNEPIKDENGNKVNCKYTKQQKHVLDVIDSLMRISAMSKKEYKHFIKCDSTTEYELSHHIEDSIIFEHVPSLAHIKYTPTFMRNPKLKERYAEYLEGVRNGTRKINTAVSTVYDIYKNRNKEGFDADMWFDHLEKISGSFLPIIDVSGSMSFPENHDALGKALSIGYYLSRYSTFMTNKFMSFSERPRIVDIDTTSFVDAINSIKRGPMGYNTNFEAVMNVLKQVPNSELPEWIVVLSDMNFDQGAHTTIEEVMDMWHENGITTKIIWWNLSSMNAVCPETVAGGNIFMSGYSPMLLKFLKVGFDARMFLDEMLDGYAKNILEANTKKK